MSQLEETARRVLTPFILGEPGLLAREHQPAIAAWTQKTALVAMLLSSDTDRAQGYGLPSSEYTALFERRASREPLSASQFWIGQYTGAREWSVRGVPITVTAKGLASPDGPQGYVMTVILGKLVLQGIRFTSPLLATPMSSSRDLAQIWPVERSVDWPAGADLGDDAFHQFTRGEELGPQEAFMSLSPWKAATELAASRMVGTLVELPTACGKHVVYYPAALAEEAQHGRFYAFITSCECDMAYLICAEPDGAHMKMAGAAEGVTDAYESLAGIEREVVDANGQFTCKELT